MVLRGYWISVGMVLKGSRMVLEALWNAVKMVLWWC
jgi:hypothetical protein